MIFAKFENDKLIICPRNGYVEDVAISNLPTFFENNPDVAKKEGWKELVTLDDPSKNICYTERNGKIYEVSEDA